jgi:hypothetical protein
LQCPHLPLTKVSPAQSGGDNTPYHRPEIRRILLEEIIGDVTTSEHYFTGQDDCWNRDREQICHADTAIAPS